MSKGQHPQNNDHPLGSVSDRMDFLEPIYLSFLLARLADPVATVQYGDRINVTISLDAKTMERLLIFRQLRAARAEALNNGRDGDDA